MKEYVCGFLFSPDKRKVVLIQKNKPEWQKGLLNGVGGKIKEGESPIQSMVREFKEETGLNRPNWTFFCELETEDKSAHVYFFYSFAAYSVRVKQMTDEKVILFPVKNIHKVPCIPNLNWLLYMCLDNQHISGKLYGYDLGDIDAEELFKDVTEFTNQSDPVIIIDEYKDAEIFGIYEDELTIVERD